MTVPHQCKDPGSFSLHRNHWPYDSASAGQSARNMVASMGHLGYYNSKAEYKADTMIETNGQKRVHVSYRVKTGKPR